MYHRVVVVGHLGRDPEMRYTPSGTPVTNFSMATTRKWTGNDGQQREETCWFRVSAWGKLGEICNQYLSKGRLALVEGELRPDENGGPRIWTGNDGVARASFELNARTVRFLGGRGEGVAQVEPGMTVEEPPPGITDESELPF